MREINHLSIHEWLRSAIPDSQQPTSPIGLLFLKLPPPPCAVLLVSWSQDYHLPGCHISSIGLSPTYMRDNIDNIIPEHILLSPTWTYPFFLPWSSTPQVPPWTPLQRHPRHKQRRRTAPSAARAPARRDTSREDLMCGSTLPGHFRNYRWTGYNML